MLFQSCVGNAPLATEVDTSIIELKENRLDIERLRLLLKVGATYGEVHKVLKPYVSEPSIFMEFGATCWEYLVLRGSSDAVYVEYLRNGQDYSKWVIGKPPEIRRLEVHRKNIPSNGAGSRPH